VVTVPLPMGVSLYGADSWEPGTSSIRITRSYWCIWMGGCRRSRLASLTSAAKKYWAATNPRAEIIDCSGVTEFAIASDRIRQLARQRLKPDAANRHRVIIVPAVHAYGLARMYQIVAEQKRPLITVVRTMGAAF
jgi:hypothetical protein